MAKTKDYSKPRDPRDIMTRSGSTELASTHGKHAKNINYIAEVSKIALSADRNDINTMYDCLRQYLELTAEYDLPIGNMNCYAAMGIDSGTASQWYNGENAERRELITQVKKICAAARELSAQTGLINPVLAIFYSKNFDGMRDQAEVVVSAPNNLDGEDAASIMQRYAALPDD